MQSGRGCWSGGAALQSSTLTGLLPPNTPVQGMDAITGVGKIMEGFANTLDSVIGQAFEDWGTKAAELVERNPIHARQPAAAGHAAGPLRPIQPAAGSQAGAGGTWERGAECSADQQAKENAAKRRGVAGRQMQVTSFMSKINAASELEVQEWRRRAQQLAQELQLIKEQQEEYQRIKEEYAQLQEETRRKAAQDPSPDINDAACAVDPCVADPLAAQQVTHQMEALLSEKAKLAQENARLLRENNGLQVGATTACAMQGHEHLLLSALAYSGLGLTLPLHVSAGAAGVHDATASGDGRRR